MSEELSGKRVAVLATEGVEQSELMEPVKALKAAGAEVEVVSPESKRFQGYKGHEKGEMISVDRKLDAARPAEYEALVLPGGVMNPDTLRPSRRPLISSGTSSRRISPSPRSAMVLGR